MAARRKGQGWLSVEAVPDTAYTSWLIYEFALPLVSSFSPYWGPLHICYTSRSSLTTCVPPTPTLKSGLQRIDVCRALRKDSLPATWRKRPEDFCEKLTFVVYKQPSFEHFVIAAQKKRLKEMFLHKIPDSQQRRGGQLRPNSLKH